MIEDVTPIAEHRDRHPEDAIGNLLVEGGHLTPVQLEQVLDEQKRRRRRFGEIAVRLGFARQDEIASQRDDLVMAIKGQLQQDIDEVPLFTVQWSLA